MTAATDTFISNHLKAMNPCDHPSLLDNHGMFLEEHIETSSPKPHTKLLPIFSLSKTPLNQDIPITPVGKDGQFESAGVEPKWNQKQGKMYWRGLATGMFHNKKGGHKWRQNHRERLHFLANDRTGSEEDVMVPVGATGQTKYERHRLDALGNYYTNAKLAQGPWQCDEGDGTCAEMQSEIEFAPKDPMEESNKYKYILDTDGNAWSSRFPRVMQGLNVKLKATVFPEWNTLILPEWFAYVPIKLDYSDLYSALAFFRGSPSGRGSHDEVARRIARNGQCWVERSECFGDGELTGSVEERGPRGVHVPLVPGMGASRLGRPRQRQDGECTNRKVKPALTTRTLSSSRGTGTSQTSQTSRPTSSSPALTRSGQAAALA